MNRVLVPVEILEGESVSSGLIDLLGPLDVTLLGYHVLPEQTPADQARQQYEERAVSALEDIAAEFSDADGSIETRLVFTHDEQQTIERVADEIDARTYVISGATGPIESLLVPLSGDVSVENILTFTENIIGDRPVGVTLFLASEETDEARRLLDEAAARLRNSGLDVETRLVEKRPFDALLDAAPGHDAIVVGEAAPSLSSFILGDEAERIAAASVGPVLVVRRENEAEDETEDGAEDKSEGKPENESETDST